MDDVSKIFTQSSSESAKLLQNSLNFFFFSRVLGKPIIWRFHWFRTGFENCRLLSSLFWLAESCWKPLVCTHTHPHIHTHTHTQTCDFLQVNQVFCVFIWFLKWTLEVGNINLRYIYVEILRYRSYRGNYRFNISSELQLTEQEQFMAVLYFWSFASDLWSALIY